MLTACGWTPSTGESAACLCARLPELRSINLFYGHFGDIELHLQGFGSPVRDPDMEDALMTTPREAAFFGQQVLVPAPGYWLALTLDSSGLDAHAHSDWLVDCAAILCREVIDKTLLLSLLKRRGLTFQAEIAFSCLRHRLGCEVPGLDELRAHNAALGRPLRHGTLLQCKPRCDWTPRQKLARGFAKQLRIRKARRAIGGQTGTASRMLRGKIRRLSGKMTPEKAPALSAALSPDVFDKGGFELTLAVDLGGSRRRYDFEASSDRGHICRLRARDVLGRSGPCRLVFRGEHTFGEPPGRLWIAARPGKIVRSQDDTELARYGAQAFAVLAAKPLSSDQNG